MRGPSGRRQGRGRPVEAPQRDFALWKAAEPGRELKWDSPWGEGFPGWHIECTAMSIKYLGERFDIHTGGVDNIFPHHEGEIAQSDSFAGGPVVNTWLHGQHLLADGVKMAKSARNSFTVSDLEAKGIEPLAFRYLCMTARYGTRLNFTFASLKAGSTRAPTPAKPRLGVGTVAQRLRILRGEHDPLGSPLRRAAQRQSGHAGGSGADVGPGPGPTFPAGRSWTFCWGSTAFSSRSWRLASS